MHKSFILEKEMKEFSDKLILKCKELITHTYISILIFWSSELSFLNFQGSNSVYMVSVDGENSSTPLVVNEIDQMQK